MRSLYEPFVLFISLIVFLMMTACSATGDTADGVIAPAEVGSEIYNLGQTVYNIQCSACHGIEGEGQFPDAPLERDATGRYGAPPHDDTGHTWHHDDDLLIRIIRDGGMGDAANFYVMPGFDAVLSNEEIEAVIAYIKTMWTEEQVDVQEERTILIREQQP